MKAVLTTGGRVGLAYAAQAHTDIKALAEIRGRSMLDRAIDALRACGIERIAVVAESPVRDAVMGRVEAIVDGAETGAKNVVRALRAWPEDGQSLLYLTSDMPYIDGRALQDFIDRSPRDALTMPLASFDAFSARFPESPPFGISLGGERVVNGGVFHIPAGASERVAAIAADFFDARKAPWRMASLAGPALLLRFAFARLRLENIESRASEVLGCPVKAIRNAAPELAYDADTVDEFRYARDRW